MESLDIKELKYWYNRNSLISRGFRCFWEKQEENKVRKDSIDTFIDRLKSQDTILTDFYEALCTSTIDEVVIEDDIIFYFRDGTKIKQELS